MSDPAALERLQSWGADIAIVLGSGLASFTEGARAEDCIPYSGFADLSPPRVPGHVGQFVLGTVGGAKMIFACGRVHLYEGHSAHAVTAGVRILANAGVTRLILINAAGSANRGFAPGSWMMIADHLNLTGTTPLLGAPGFIDMSEIYSREWRSRFAEAASAIGMTLHEGVYAGLQGPQYETAAEVRMLANLGADAIGMSTVLEAIQARALGMTVAGFSCLTNWAAGLSEQRLSHEEVLRAGKNAAADLEQLLETAL